MGVEQLAGGRILAVDVLNDAAIRKIAFLLNKSYSGAPARQACVPQSAKACGLPAANQHAGFFPHAEQTRKR
jgi:hypothetical protein